MPPNKNAAGNKMNLDFNMHEWLILISVTSICVTLSLSWVIYTYLRLKYPHWITGVKENGTQVFCICKNDMTKDNSFVSNTYKNDGNHVLYKCAKCGEESDFDFDYPVPVLRKSK
jgi:hypothetical protein